MRTYGARDKHKRKRRSDLGKRRKFYRKKPTKRKRTIKGVIKTYTSKRSRGDPIKIWWWKEERMSLDGLRRFPRKVRHKVRKIIYKPTLRMDVPPDYISSKEKVESLAEQHLWEGVWLMMGFSHGKNKFFIKPVKLAKIRIIDTSNGLKARMIQNYRLFRYWFWKR